MNSKTPQTGPTASSSTIDRKLSLTAIVLSVYTAAGAMSAIGVQVMTQKTASIKGEKVHMAGINQAITVFQKAAKNVLDTLQLADITMEGHAYTNVEKFTEHITVEVGKKLAEYGVVDNVSFTKVMDVVHADGLAGVFANLADKMEIILIGTDEVKAKLDIANLSAGAQDFLNSAAEDGFDLKVHQLGEAWANFQSRINALAAIYTELDLIQRGGIKLSEQADGAKFGVIAGIKTATGGTTVDKTTATAEPAKTA